MSTSYQVHVTTLGQMSALISHYLALGYRQHTPCSLEERLTEYPVVVLYTKDKMIGGNRTVANHPSFLSIPFDQAFDLPIRKEKVSFIIGQMEFTLKSDNSVSAYIPFGSGFNVDTNELIDNLLRARKELYPDKY